MPRNPNAFRPATCSGPDCDAPLVQSALGRPRLYCSPRCTDRAQYEPKRSANAQRAVRWRGLDLSGIVDDALCERFWSKVDKSGECWVWTRGCDPGGYGRFTLRRQVFHGAHTVSFALTKGPVPPGLVVCHHCDNPPCVRPEHLFLGTQRDNALDSVSKGRAYRASGEASPVARLTEEAVREIRSTAPYFGFKSDLARKFNVAPRTIIAVLNGESWRHVA